MTLLSQIENFVGTAKQAIKTKNNEIALKLMKSGFDQFDYIQDFFIVIIYTK